uniref:Cytochrome P450 CYP3036A1 n=1 Tax=Tigriopus kingsejongensis TaxID=1133412 RepID=A0A2H4FY70_9MAXI|nr:cytochrome P450 CYP3036A1 [Tigriopus kingsejongensis]
MFLWIVLVLCVLFLYKYWYLKTRIPSKFPPGPIGLPVVGCYDILSGPNLNASFARLHQKYGSVFSVNLGPSDRFVIIGDHDILVESFKDMSLTTRPEIIQWFNVYSRYGDGHTARGLMFSEGDEWLEQRRVTLRHLRDFGFGKTGMEALILNEIQELLEVMETEIGTDVRFKGKFNSSIINVLWTIMTGRRCSLNDPKMQEVIHAVDEVVSQSNPTALVNIFPPSRHVIPGLSGFTAIMIPIRRMIAFIQDTLNDHQASHDPNAEPRDFIDAHLNKIHESESNPSSSFHGQIGLQNLEVSMLDLFFAGVETTSNVLSFSVLYMVNFPDIQEKMFQEIKAKIGLYRLPSMNDRPDTPYTEAVIQEILRYSAIAALGIFRVSSRDVQLGPYQIPKGTTVFSNLLAVLRDPKIFPDPEKFDPTRFLDKDGNFQKNEKNIAFGTGKRDCLGKSLALAEFYIFFAALIQKFEFLPPSSGEIPDLEPDTTFIRQAPDFMASFKRRQL